MQPERELYGDLSEPLIVPSKKIVSTTEIMALFIPFLPGSTRCPSPQAGTLGRAGDTWEAQPKAEYCRAPEDARLWLSRGGPLMSKRLQHLLSASPQALRWQEVPREPSGMAGAGQEGEKR